MTKWKKSSYYLQAETENINLKLYIQFLNWNSSFLSASWTDSSYVFRAFSQHVVSDGFGSGHACAWCADSVGTNVGVPTYFYWTCAGADGFIWIPRCLAKSRKNTMQIGNAMKLWSPNQWTVYVDDVTLHILKHIYRLMLHSLNHQLFRLFCLVSRTQVQPTAEVYFARRVNSSPQKVCEAFLFSSHLALPHMPTRLFHFNLIRLSSSSQLLGLNVFWMFWQVISRHADDFLTFNFRNAQYWNEIQSNPGANFAVWPKMVPAAPFCKGHSHSLHCSPSRGDVYVSQFVGSVCRSCGGKRNEYVRWVRSVDSSRFVPDPSGWCSWVCWMLLAHCHRLSAQKFTQD